MSAPAINDGHGAGELSVTITAGDELDHLVDGVLEALGRLDRHIREHFAGADGADGYLADVRAARRHLAGMGCAR